MSINYLERIYQAIKIRSFNIKCEIQLLQDQFSFIDNLKVKEDRVRRMTYFKLSTLISVQKLYEYYLEIIGGQLKSPCPFKRAMLIHYSAISELFNNENSKYYKGVQDRLTEIDTNQYEILTISNMNLFKYESIEKLVELIYFLFPYRAIIDLISKDNKFFTNLIKISFDYSSSNPKSYVDCLKQVFKSFPPGWENLNKEVILSISEVLISIFTFQLDNQTLETNLESFEVSERCKYLVKRNLQQLSINNNFISIIEKNLGFSLSKNESNDSKHDCIPLEYVNDSTGPIMCIHHVVLELRKLPLQPSVSLMCCILLRTMNFLDVSLCIDGNFVGADESFQFFVAALADARLYHLPKIRDQMKKFVVSDLTVGKITFIISKLDCAIDYIKMRILPVPQYILFPFKREDIPELHLVTPAEYKSDKQAIEESLNASSKDDKNSSEKVDNEKTKTAENDETKAAENDENKTAENGETKTTENDETKTTENDETKTTENDETKTDENDETKTTANPYSYVDINFESDSNDYELVLTGFKVCAFPTFIRSKTEIPSILLCTGDARDKAVVYRYTLQTNTAIDILGHPYSQYGSIHGVIYHLKNRSQYRGLIFLDSIPSPKKVDDSNGKNMLANGEKEAVNYEKCVKEVGELSNLILLLPEQNSTPYQQLHPPRNDEKSEIVFGGLWSRPEWFYLSNLPKLSDNFEKFWSHYIPFRNSLNFIEDIQNRLINIYKLDDSYKPDGIIDKETVKALINCKLPSLSRCFAITKSAYKELLDIKLSK